MFDRVKLRGGIGLQEVGSCGGWRGSALILNGDIRAFSLTISQTTTFVWAAREK